MLLYWPRVCVWPITLTPYKLHWHSSRNEVLPRPALGRFIPGCVKNGAPSIAGFNSFTVNDKMMWP